MLAPLFAASVLSLGGPVGNLDLTAGVRTASTARMMDESALADGSRPALERRRLDLDVEPHFVLSNDARLELRLTYTPTVRVPFEATPPGVEEMPSSWDRATWLHNATFDASREIGRSTARLGVRASHGVVEPYDGVLGADQPVVTMERVPYLAYGATAGVTTSPWRRTTLEVSATGSAAGGDGEAAQVSFPLYQELRLDGALTYDAGRRTTYGGIASVAGSRVNESDAITSRLGGLWRKGMGPTTTLGAMGGAAMVLELEGTFASYGPWAEGSLLYEPNPRLPTFGFALGLEPGVDRTLGAVHYRWYAEARTDWIPARRWELGAFGTGALLQPWSGYGDMEVDPTWFGRLGVRATYELGRFVTAGAGLTSLWQSSGRPDLPSFREVAAMLELRAVLLP